MEKNKTPIKELTISEISEILTSGGFNKFIGIRENEIFEAKSYKPYDINNQNNNEKIHAIAELSNDQASFANQKGGYIVCGLDTPSIKNIPHGIVDS